MERFPSSVSPVFNGSEALFAHYAVFDTVETIFHLEGERPPPLTGFQARLAANVALHPCCLWLNNPWAVLHWPSLTCLSSNTLLRSHPTRFRAV